MVSGGNVFSNVCRPYTGCRPFWVPPPGQGRTGNFCTSTPLLGQPIRERGRGDAQRRPSRLRSSTSRARSPRAPCNVGPSRPRTRLLRPSRAGQSEGGVLGSEGGRLRSQGTRWITNGRCPPGGWRSPNGCPRTGAASAATSAELRFSLGVPGRGIPAYLALLLLVAGDIESNPPSN